jgi:hypothetical protein
LHFVGIVLMVVGGGVYWSMTFRVSSCILSDSFIKFDNDRLNTNGSYDLPLCRVIGLCCGRSKS